MEARSLSLIAAVMLGGCANGYSLPPATPTAAAIKAEYDAQTAAGLPAKDYAAWAYTLIKRNCHDWFSQQIAGASQNSLLSTELSLFGTAAGAAGGPVGAGIAGALGLGAATIGNVQANAAAGLDPTVTYGLWEKIEKAWLAAAQDPKTAADASGLVEDFAERCQLPALKKAVADAVSGASVTTIPATSTAIRSLEGAPSRVLAPDVVVNGPEASPAAPAPPPRAKAPTPPQASPEPRASILRPILRPIVREPIDPETQRRADEEWRAIWRAVSERDAVLRLVAPEKAQSPPGPPNGEPEATGSNRKQPVSSATPTPPDDPAPPQRRKL